MALRDEMIKYQSQCQSEHAKSFDAYYNKTILMIKEAIKKDPYNKDIVIYPNWDTHTITKVIKRLNGEGMRASFGGFSDYIQIKID